MFASVIGCVTQGSKDARVTFVQVECGWRALQCCEAWWRLRVRGSVVGGVVVKHQMARASSTSPSLSLTTDYLFLYVYMSASTCSPQLPSSPCLLRITSIIAYINEGDYNLR